MTVVISLRRASRSSGIQPGAPVALLARRSGRPAPGSLLIKTTPYKIYQDSLQNLVVTQGPGFGSNTGSS